MGILDNLGGKRISTMLEGVVGSVIGENSKFKGEFTTSGSINVNGEFEGVIRADREVIISPGGKVTGEVYGGSVVISGHVNGNITAKEGLEIGKSGRVQGDLKGGKIVIEEGSSYQGRVVVESETAPAQNL
jgi:cytoskeletal protein CcmA (bactofilin family)